MNGAEPLFLTRDELPYPLEMLVLVYEGKRAREATRNAGPTVDVAAVDEVSDNRGKEMRKR